MCSLRDVAFLYYTQNIYYGGIYLNAACQNLPLILSRTSQNTGEQALRPSGFIAQLTGP